MRNYLFIRKIRDGSPRYFDAKYESKIHFYIFLPDKKNVLRIFKLGLSIDLISKIIKKYHPSQSDLATIWFHEITLHQFDLKKSLSLLNDLPRLKTIIQKRVFNQIDSVNSSLANHLEFKKKIKAALDKNNFSEVLQIEASLKKSIMKKSLETKFTGCLTNLVDIMYEYSLDDDNSDSSSLRLT